MQQPPNAGGAPGAEGRLPQRAHGPRTHRHPVPALRLYKCECGKPCSLDKQLGRESSVGAWTPEPLGDDPLSADRSPPARQHEGVFLR